MHDRESPLTFTHKLELCEALPDEVSSQLRSALAAKEEFDATLLDYCRRRTGPRFFFDHHKAAELASDIMAQMPDEAAAIIQRADLVLAHRFQAADDEYMPYDVQLPADFSWYILSGTDGESVHALNRHRFWPYLAMAYRFTGNDRYTSELRRQIASWCEQTPLLEDLDDWIKPEIAPRWHLLDTAIRADTWVWTYELLLDTPEWTPEINSLFVYFLWQHGRFLHHNLPLTHKHIPIAGVNWLIMEAQGLLNIALLFPEFKQSIDWKTQALVKLEECLVSQFEADGGHVEQSPSYHECCLRWLAEPLHLARLNGCVLSGDSLTRLVAAGEALYQLMQPDGTMPALSDSDRTANGVLTQLGLFLDRPEWTRFHALSARDAWFFGGVSQTPPPSTARPSFVALRESGYYILRSGDERGAIQMIFDCGPKGGGHGHLDLLSIDLYGFGQCLIPDPGRLTYDDTPERKWLVSTPAHNTISIDGGSHAAQEGSDNPQLHKAILSHVAGGVLLTAGHDGYRHLLGAPRVSRSIWFDGDSVFLIVDQVGAAAEHEYMVSFTLPGVVATMEERIARNTGVSYNITLQPIPIDGQKICLRDSFWSPNYGERKPAKRFEVTQRDRSAQFATIIDINAANRPTLQASWRTASDDSETIGIWLHNGKDDRLVEVPALMT
jgi:hypothetical protein